MPKNRYLFILAVALLALLQYSCRSSSKLKRDPFNGGNRAVWPSPSWFSQQSIVKKGQEIRGYAIAAGRDSISTIHKSIAWGREALKSYCSKRIDRTQKALNRDSLKPSNDDVSPQFIKVLHKASDDAIDSASSASRTQVNRIGMGRNFRGYSEVYLTKADYLNYLDEHLTVYKENWTQVKQSLVFKQIFQK